ncbi:MAG: ABC transporter permease [Anaerolineae bacterium]|nr:ABC transporter permease [Anaerolineae bacterium]
MNPTVSTFPLYRTAWRRIRRRPFQYVLFIIGVALGVAMMVSIDLANGSASRAFALSADTVTGKTTHRIIGGPTGLDESVYVALRNELGYKLSAPVVEGYVGSPELGSQPVRLLGVDPFAEPPFRSYLGGEQGAIGTDLGAFLVEPNSVLISAEFAAANDLALSDTLTIDFAGQTTPARIIGLIETTDALTERGLSNLIFMDIGSAQQVLDQVGTLSHIDLIVEDDAVLAQISAILPANANIETAAARGNAIQQMTAAFELNLTAMSLLALVVGMFLIYNTVTFSVVQRRPMFGILRCVGVTGGQLATLILAEAAVLGLIGSLLGLGLGVILGQGMVGLVTQTINDLYFVVNVQSVTVPAFTLVKGLVIGVAAALFASLLPAIDGMRTPPNATLRRSTLESKITTLQPWLIAGGIALGVMGALFLWIDLGGLILAFAGIFAILFAAALLTPPTTVVLMRILTPIGNRLLGVLGRMAPRDIIRSLSRTSIAIAALMIAVSVIIGLSIMVGSFRQTVEIWLEQTLRADIYLSPPTTTNASDNGFVAPDVMEAALAWPGVERGVSARSVEIFAPDLAQSIDAFAVSDDVSNGNRPIFWSDGDDETLWDRVLAGEGVIISEPFMVRHNISIPPAPLTLQTPSGPREFPVLAVLYDYTSERGVVWLGKELFSAEWGDDRISDLALFVEPGVDIDAIVAAMQTEFADMQALTITSNEGLRAGSLEVFDRTFAITSALRLLATVVAFIGVLSALMSLQLERARELGVLRATGMTLSQLWRLTFLETGLMGSTAGILAMPVGFILAWILIYVINLRSFGWTLQMYLEPGYFVQAFLIAVVAALLAAIYPSLRLGKTVIASAIRSE